MIYRKSVLVCNAQVVPKASTDANGCLIDIVSYLEGFFISVSTSGEERKVDWGSEQGNERLEKPTVFQIFFDYYVCDCIKNKFDILGVCGTGQVTIYLFILFPYVQV